MPPIRGRTIIPIPASPWKPGKVRVVTDEEEESYFDGLILGGISVRQGIANPSQWYVASQTAGLLICTVSSEEDAKRIGEYLWGKCCLAFREQTVEKITARLPLWVKPWVRECRKRKGWVDPTPFLAKKWSPE